MSDLLAPVSLRSIPDTQEERERVRNDLLANILTELKILNLQLQVGLNSDIDVDLLRQDPYYNGSHEGGAEQE